MWDNSTPLELLKTMPKVLENEHLEKLNRLLEADKYKNQLLSGTDLCGKYAPICEGCDKEKKYPCAVAYVNYLKEQGMDIDIATDEAESVENDAESITAEAENITEEKSDEQSTETDKESVAEEKPAEKLIIRIATARKKTIL